MQTRTKQNRTNKATPKPIKMRFPTDSVWNLKALFTSQKQAQGACIKAQNVCKNFAKTYEGKLHTLGPKEFEIAIKEYENLCENLGKIMTYAFLLFAQDTTNGSIYAEFEHKVNKAQNDIVFFDLELARLDSQKLNAFMQSAPQYKFYLQNIAAQAKHNLTLKEEQIILKLSPIGSDAFGRLFDEHLAQMRFNMGEKNLLSEEEILARLHHPQQKMRKKAQKVFSKKLAKSRHLLTYILNIVRKDVALTKQLRGYPKSESFRHISNCISQKSVDTLIESVTKNFHIVQQYYKLKAKMLGLKTLKDYDRYAPLETKTQDAISYNKALELVLHSFNTFSPRFSDIIKEAIKNGWVDSHPKPNKRGGAFSHGAVPSAHPYVLLNYTDSRRDIFTIAHEFGHMIHQELSKKMGYLNMDTPLTTAETASVFGEMLLFDTLKTKLSKEELIPLYAGKLEDIFSTLFRQIVMTNFERAIHSTEGELQSQDFDRIWLEENAKMFGDSLKLTKNYASWWCYIPHFIHSPFYCYAYSYGQLLVLALFGLYKRAQTPKERQKFIKTYTEFLSLGGSQSPRKLVKKFGFDIEDGAFWDIGIQEVQKLFSEFEGLLA